MRTPTRESCSRVLAAAVPFHGAEGPAHEEDAGETAWHARLGPRAGHGEADVLPAIGDTGPEGRPEPVPHEGPKRREDVGEQGTTARPAGRQRVGELPGLLREKPAERALRLAQLARKGVDVLPERGHLFPKARGFVAPPSALPGLPDVTLLLHNHFTSASKLRQTCRRSVSILASVGGTVLFARAGSSSRPTHRSSPGISQYSRL